MKNQVNREEQIFTKETFSVQRYFAILQPKTKILGLMGSEKNILKDFL